MSMQVKELLAIGEKQLAAAGVENAALDCKLIFAHVARVPFSKVFLEYGNILSDMQCDTFFELLDKRCEGWPLQYITGEQEFMGLTFKVDPSVLIPRPETEILTENAISLINDGTFAKGTRQVVRRDRPELTDVKCSTEPKKLLKNMWTVLDLCCGSGAIGVSIAKLARSVKVCCSDLSRSAVETAKKNAELNKVSVNFYEGDLFDPFRKRFGKKTRFDMIVTNPPYVKRRDVEFLQKEIREHEPVSALDGGEDGLDIIKRIINEAPDYLKKDAVILMEIGSEQMEQVQALFEENGRYGDVTGIKDLAGRDRIAFAVFNG